MNPQTFRPVMKPEHGFGRKGSPQPFEDLARELDRLANTFVKIYKARERKKDTFLGATLTQCLTILSFDQEPCLSMQKLSEAIGLANSTMTRVVDRLVAKELVRRFSGDADRRQVCVELTEKGRAALAEIKELQLQFFVRLVGQISPKERKVVQKGVQCLNRALSRPVFRDLFAGL